MYLALISLITALTISGVAIYYSVIGLTAIFAAAAIPIMVMGVALEIAKLVATLWLHKNWKVSPFFIKSYLTSAVIILMFITSMGIFGFLSKAHMDQSLVSGDVQSKIAVYDEKIKIAKDNIDANRKALKQMDEAVDQVMGRSSDEKGADKAVAVRRSQQKERARLQSEIQAEQKTVTALSEERAPIAAEVRKVEAEVGPIKYIAAFVYGADPDANVLEKAVTWVIIIIVFVFDPLAVILLLASQYSFKDYLRRKGIISETDPEEEVEYKSTVAEKLAERITRIRQYFADSASSIKSSLHSPLHKKQEVIAEPEVITQVPVIENTVDIVQEANDKIAEIEKVEEYEIEPWSDTEPVSELTATPISLDEMKEKLSVFVEAVRPAPMYSTGPTAIKGFDVPKVNSAIIDNVLPTTKNKLTASVPTPVVEVVEELDLPDQVGIEAWNKMIEEAEKAVSEQQDFPKNPKIGQVYEREVDGVNRQFIFNSSDWIDYLLSNQEVVKDLVKQYETELKKYSIIPELAEHIESKQAGYVQNEEQVESSLWKETRDSLSQEEYQNKVNQATNKKEKNVGQNNPDQSA